MPRSSTNQVIDGVGFWSTSKWALGAPLTHSVVISAVPKAVVGKGISPRGSTPMLVSIG